MLRTSSSSFKPLTVLFSVFFCVIFASCYNTIHFIIRTIVTLSPSFLKHNCTTSVMQYSDYVSCSQFCVDRILDILSSSFTPHFHQITTLCHVILFRYQQFFYFYEFSFLHLLPQSGEGFVCHVSCRLFT